MPGESTNSATPAADAFADVVGRLGSAESLLIVTHARADGDGLGSMVALSACARAAGKHAAMLVPDTVPQRYEFLLAGAAVADGGAFAGLARRADCVVIVDTCALGQLDGLCDALGAVRDKVVVIDHHATVDPVGAVQWVDASAAAAGVMVGELVEALGWPVSLAAAEALFAAVATDTGWLRFANTDARCLRAVAAWVAAGVRPDTLYRKIYQDDRPERLGLIARVLDGIEFACGGRLAVMTLRKADFQQTGAREAETENLVNEALRVGAVDTAVLLVETTDCVRVSLRSRGAVDVAAVAQGFGGGGHRRAAGLRLDEDIDTLKRRLVAACSDALHDA